MWELSEIAREKEYYMFLSLLAAAIAVAPVETTATATWQKIRTGSPILSVVAAAGYSGRKSSCCPVLDQ